MVVDDRHGVNKQVQLRSSSTEACRFFLTVLNLFCLRASGYYPYLADHQFRMLQPSRFLFMVFSVLTLDTNWTINDSLQVVLKYPLYATNNNAIRLHYKWKTNITLFSCNFVADCRAQQPPPFVSFFLASFPLEFLPLRRWAEFPTELDAPFVGSVSTWLPGVDGLKNTL